MKRALIEMEKTDEKVKMGKIWAIKKPTDLGSYETAIRKKINKTAKERNEKVAGRGQTFKWRYMRILFKRKFQFKFNSNHLGFLF